MFKEVHLHKREEMGNKRLGGLLLRQAIHSSCKEIQKSRAEIGEWKSEDGKMNVACREMICRHVLWHYTSCIVLYYNRLSVSQRDQRRCSTVTVCLQIFL